MVNKKISDGVGKKIVEALKKQSEIEINTKSETDEVTDNEELDLSAFDETPEQEEMNDVTETEIPDFSSSVSDFSTVEEHVTEPVREQQAQPAFETSYNTSSNAGFQSYNQPQQSVNSFVDELDTFEIPNNIAILKKLITQLPKGVTRYTGAQIIKQTMEALGISMKSVLQEAQAVQENLNNSAKECQATIQEYKKQIITLEKQAQSNQRQYAALNELISLFVQTGV